MPDISRLEQNFYQRWRDLEPFEAQTELKDYARYVSLARAVPLGHEVFAVGTSAVGLPNLPANVKRLQIYAFTNTIYYTDHGVDPSGALGFPIPADTVFIYDSDVNSSFKLWAASSTNVRVAYYG